ncbi:cytidine deaminase [Polaribacter sp. Hel1_33_78]|jgi:cytidine deaminase|uniref:cytidine deaminase n=1 Tax=unclassified Polaribacter TaxID=196858 RepID=UPI00056D6B1E|nr:MULTISPECIES: cytidine deaminase [unclassified Polaribacter]MBT3741023.1 cytidine deaminase [Polaribacter sp.]MDG1195529.1 cytidine deaminase [Polaribacter sp.]MDG2435609.1 cytidine deaminase [Polaribacter sp.]PKV65390.1 cytidine deaminase [Polaribacter sp. Hel1_33_96]SDT95438.1 cytidine deaminase [Polaribacter sp. Hel1_33_78]
MRKIEISTSVTVYTDVSELSSEDKMLMDKAVEARKKAYAPYSKFKVGAALLLENNQIVLGNNQENAAYPSGMCAERVAIWKAGSEFPGVKILKLVISASSSITKVERPVGPCGACRQSLSEYEIKQKQPFEVLFMGEVGEIVKTASLLSLLPFSFDSSYL